MAVDKVYVSANQLLDDSFRLARMIYEDGFHPDFLVGLWRGGTPPGIAIHEFFRMKELDPYHTAIKTQSYTGIEEQSDIIEIKGLGHVIDRCNAEEKMLIVDDVFDTGRTVDTLIKEIKKLARRNTPEIRVAVIFYKPTKSLVEVKPDYHLRTTENWIVFPHELEGLTKDEIMEKNKYVYEVLFGESEPSINGLSPE